MPPHLATVWSTRFCNSSLRAMWHGMTTVLPPLSLIAAATASHASRLRLEITTVAPYSAMRVAIARPMPLVEPVTIATFPVKIEQRRHLVSPCLPQACHATTRGPRLVVISSRGLRCGYQ